MEETYCQSCGMLLGRDSSLYGTNEDGSRNIEYCKYCYNEGAFTSDLTLSEMVDICVPQMLSENQGMKEDEARKLLRKLLPTLKRWEHHI